MTYEILTKKLSVFHENRDYNDESYLEKLTEKQYDFMIAAGYDYDKYYLIRKGNKYDIATIDDAIQSLAIKDGVDLVRFTDGTIGFVAYYNGFTPEENHVAILCSSDKLIEEYENEFPVCDAEKEFYSEDWSFKWRDDLYADYLISYLNWKDAQ